MLYIDVVGGFVNMQRYSLSVVFSKDLDKFLVCYNKNQEKYNFVGGKIEPNEDVMDGSYRELFEETGIPRSIINLSLFREEIVFLKPDVEWHLYITAGVLEEDIELVEEKNPLSWVSIGNALKLISDEFMGHGNCYTFFIEACEELGICIKKPVGFHLSTESTEIKNLSILRTDSVFEFSMQSSPDNMLFMDKDTHNSIYNKH